MAETSKAWLPETALRDGKLEDWMMTSVKSWVDDWFTSRGDHALDLQLVSDPEPEATVKQLGACVMTETGREMLLHSFIGIKANDKPTKEADRNILSGLVNASLSDLNARLQYPVAGENELVDEKVVVIRYRVRLGTSTLFHLCMSRDFIIRKRRDMCTRSNSNTGRTAHFSKALSGESVTIEAEIGQIDLNMEDLVSLKVGDVLTFNTPLSESFPLRVNRRACPDISARYLLTTSDQQEQSVPGIILETVHDL